MMSNWLSAAEGLVAAAIPVVGLIYTYAANRRSQYDRVLAPAAESGMPPISQDRHVIGTAFEPLSKLPPGKPVMLSGDAIQALFNILWYVQRADAMYKSLRSPLLPRRITRTQALLLASLGSALDIWNAYMRLELVDTDGRIIPVAKSAAALRHLAGEHDRLRAQE
jgi:hypothetical protein